MGQGGSEGEGRGGVFQMEGKMRQMVELDVFSSGLNGGPCG